MKKIKIKQSNKIKEDKKKLTKSWIFSYNRDIDHGIFPHAAKNPGQYPRRIHLRLPLFSLKFNGCSEFC